MVDKNKEQISAFGLEGLLQEVENLVELRLELENDNIIYRYHMKPNVKKFKLMTLCKDSSEVLDVVNYSNLDDIIEHYKNNVRVIKTR